MSSITVFLTTIGKPTLEDMLNSLVDELSDNDYLYIAIDGKEYFEKSYNIIHPFIKKFKCNIALNFNVANLGYWGHGCRNKYQKSLKGDFILHADDDDIYLKGSFDKIRRAIKITNNKTMLLFKFYNSYKTKDVVWKDPSIRLMNIGTPCGLIPNIPEKMGNWGHKYGGDLEFYLSSNFEYVFCDEVIYCVKPRENGYPI